MAKFRHEFKYYINHKEAIILQTRLSMLLKKDGNVGENGSYSITSLYLDNYDDKALREKQDGVNQREKFRIRYYNDDLSFIRLEKKVKSRGLCQKLSAPITKDNVKKIIEGDYAFLKDSGNPLMFELYSKINSDLLRPKVIVEYDRAPYVYNLGNVRITLDSRVRASYSIDNFLQPQNNIFVPSDIIILEVKYDEFIPAFISDIVQLASRQASAFSKYAISRNLY